MSKKSANRKNKNNKTSFLFILLVISVLAISFVAGMGYLNYRSTAIALEESVVARIEDDIVADLETSLSFGKSFDTYYGIDEIFEDFSSQIDDTFPFIISPEGKLMYYAGDDTESLDRLAVFLKSSEFTKVLPELELNSGSAVTSGRERAIFTAIYNEDELKGYFGTFYNEDIFSSGMKEVFTKLLVTVAVISVVDIIVFCVYFKVLEHRNIKYPHKRKNDRNTEKLMQLFILSLGVILISVLSLYLYQADYRLKTVDALNTSLKNLENTIKDVRDDGVELREVIGLKEYIYSRVNKLDILRSVRISERIVEIQQTDENSDVISFIFEGGNNGDEALYLEAEISQDAMNTQMRGIVLTLLSTTIILLIFVLEFSRLLELVDTGDAGEAAFSEKRVGISLRLSGFLCSTAEYMCVPYAAMMIRASGQSILGLSNGLTAALPLTMEGLTQMISMLFLPKLIKKKDMRSVLAVSSVMMILCNLGAFTMHSAIAVIAFRAAAGIAYAGFKQVSNYLITRGYESETGRSNNISQDNAGLLAGATCGAGLGAIICANMGYSITFFISALLFGVYLFITFLFMPWKALAKRSNMDEEEKPVSLASIKKMVFSAEMLFYIAFIAIPLNIGVMLCVTLVPAICQTHGISSVMLSYCYIANGIAGIYIGPALVAKAKKSIGLTAGIAISFLLAAAGIFVLKLPAIVVMIVVSSTVLGFLDGFGTPLCTDQFMELKVVKNAVDESTALIFSVVISYILLTFSPMIAEAMLIPGEGIFSPMMIGTVFYAVSAVIVFVYGANKKKRK